MEGVILRWIYCQKKKKERHNVSRLKSNVIIYQNKQINREKENRKKPNQKSSKHPPKSFD